MVCCICLCSFTIWHCGSIEFVKCVCKRVQLQTYLTFQQRAANNYNQNFEVQSINPALLEDNDCCHSVLTANTKAHLWSFAYLIQNRELSAWATILSQSISIHISLWLLHWKSEQKLLLEHNCNHLHINNWLERLPLIIAGYLYVWRQIKFLLPFSLFPETNYWI